MSQGGAIEVQGVHKSYRIPSHRVDTIKERVLHPLQRVSYTELHAVSDVSFEIAEGGFFGIVGRNGSGKTTLLKLMASIYKADRGRIRVAGRLAPFIELGVGFNPNFTARENVLLNGVIMGLTPRQARARFDKVIAFAELEDFVELKLKNYSSGMWVRLAFSVMVEADADVLLIDEVLAVGDASFQRKCTDMFDRLHAGGKTIVYVTHDMVTMQRFCDRAMLLEDGRIAAIGDPAEVGNRYLEINLERERPGAAVEGPVDARFEDVWIEDGTGARCTEFEHGQRIHLNAVIEAERGIYEPAVTFEFVTVDGTRVFGSPGHWLAGQGGRLEPGERRRVGVSVENPLAPGHYKVNWALYTGRREVPVEVASDPGGFSVQGEHDFAGVVGLDLDWRLETEPAEDLAPR